MPPGGFTPEKHFYERVLNATIHPLVSYFFRFDLERLISRYCHLNPQVDKEILESILRYTPRYLRWAGADLFHVTTAGGIRKMVIVEVNSSPSGQKSMPTLTDHDEQGGYSYLIKNTFAPLLLQRGIKGGRLAVIFDKNRMEAAGYASAMADHFQEEVLLTPFFESDPNPPVRFTQKQMEVRTEDGQWYPIRGAFRYVTQRPWNRIPVHTSTRILNPVLACLAGGRNKMIAAMAYELFNAELLGSGLTIIIPETIRDATKEEIPLLIRKFGGHAVVKVPYSNAGQGVFTITNESELDRFMEKEYPYDQFIVQSLIGNYHWSSQSALGKFYHVGTVPNRSRDIYVSDIRMMVCSTPNGFRPLAVYCRRANMPLADTIDPSGNSWEMLGTNLSVKTGLDSWKSDTSRLLLMDRKDFNVIGIGLDDLVNGFIQTVLGVVAIDKMAGNLVNKKGIFRFKLFRSINRDKPFIEEILL